MNLYFLFTILLFEIISTDGLVVKNGKSLNITVDPEIPLLHNPFTISVEFGSDLKFSLKTFLDKKPIAENCKLYDKKNPLYRCIKMNSEKTVRFDLKFDNISWTQCGNWSFKVFKYEAFVILNLSVYPNITLSIDNPQHSIQEKKGSQGAVYMDGSTSKRALILKGNENFSFHCEASCAFPRPKLTWIIKNLTMTKSIEPRDFSESQCIHHSHLSRMSTKLNFSCASLRMSGIIGVHCQSKQRHKYYPDHIVNKTIYILCPLSSEVKLSIDNLKDTKKYAPQALYSIQERKQYLGPVKMDGSSSRRALIMNPNQTVFLYCETGCSFPKPQLTWLLKNKTMTKSFKSTVSKDHSESQCADNSYLSRQSSVLGVNCQHLDMSGVIGVDCQSQQSYKTSPNHIMNKTIYILCPYNNYEDLTRGELIFIVIGTILGALIFAFLGYLLKQRTKPDLIEERSTLL